MRTALRLSGLSLALFIASRVIAGRDNVLSEDATFGSGGCSISSRDLKAHNARRGEALLGSLTILVVGGRMMRRRVIDRRSII